MPVGTNVACADSTNKGERKACLGMNRRLFNRPRRVTPAIPIGRCNVKSGEGSGSPVGRLYGQAPISKTCVVAAAFIRGVVVMAAMVG